MISLPNVKHSEWYVGFEVCLINKRASHKAIVLLMVRVEWGFLRRHVHVFGVAGIKPATHSPGMFSWFPILFPLKVGL